MFHGQKQLHLVGKEKHFLQVIQLNFQMNSAHNLAGSLRLVSPFVEFPKVVDILEQFYIDNAHKHKDTSVR